MQFRNFLISVTSGPVFTKGFKRCGFSMNYAALSEICLPQNNSFARDLSIMSIYKCNY